MRRFLYKTTYHGVIYIIFMSFHSTNRNFYGKLRKVSVVVGYDARKGDREYCLTDTRRVTTNLNMHALYGIIIQGMIK